MIKWEEILVHNYPAEETLTLTKIFANICQTAKISAMPMIIPKLLQEILMMIKYDLDYWWLSSKIILFRFLIE